MTYPLPPNPDGVGDAAWAATVERIRAYCAWHVAPELSETVTVDGPGGTDTAEIANAFREAGTPVAVIASSDKNYDRYAADVAAALREAGATRILLAGKKDVDGVDGTLHAGCDAAAVLRDTLDELEGQR